MTTKAELERVLNGTDVVASAIIRFFVGQGWSCDSIIKNVAEKRYEPHRALVRVMRYSEGGLYYVKGEYTSCGENVLATLTVYIKDMQPEEETTSALHEFLKEAEERINQSFAVRFLGPKAMGDEAEQQTALDDRPLDPHLPDFHQALKVGYKGTFYEWHQDHFGTFWCAGAAV